MTLRHGGRLLSMAEEFDVSEFYEVFLEDSLENLRALESGLLLLAKDPTQGDINKIFRAAHSIKGGAATFGFAQVAEYTHAMESLLGAIRSELIPVTSAVVDILLECNDFLHDMLVTGYEQSFDESQRLSLIDKLNTCRDEGLGSAARETDNENDLLEDPLEDFIEGLVEDQDENLESVVEASAVQAPLSTLPEVSALPVEDAASFVAEEISPVFSDDGLKIRNESAEVRTQSTSPRTASSLPALSPSTVSQKECIFFAPDADQSHLMSSIEALSQHALIDKLTLTHDSAGAVISAVIAHHTDALDALLNMYCPQVWSTAPLSSEAPALNEEAAKRDDTQVSVGEATTKRIYFDTDGDTQRITAGLESITKESKVVLVKVRNRPEGGFISAAVTHHHESIRTLLDVHLKGHWLDKPPLSQPKSALEQPCPSAHSEVSSVRVRTEKIDELINFVGELVITQSMLMQMSGAMGDLLEAPMRAVIEQLSRNTREIQGSVMQVRMLPVSIVFGRLPRLVRDLGTQLGKEVELEIIGEATELDKTVLEGLGDPLLHLLRNAVDHGIESPERRILASKPRVGRITISARHQGANVVIELKDDGIGIRPERVLERAIELGLIDENEPIEPAQILELLFTPGFSTVSEVNDVSGRGVGMDVVRNNIRQLGGSVIVESVPGCGSSFTIQLPLTLAIIDGQLVRLGDSVFVLPLLSVIETVPFVDGAVEQVVGQSHVLFNFRDDFVPIVDLAELFHVEHRPETVVRGGLIVIVESLGVRVGLKVDELLSQQQVVIKSLESNLYSVFGLSGATILGDGLVALIVDIPALINELHRPDRRNALPA